MMSPFRAPMQKVPDMRAPGSRFASFAKLLALVPALLPLAASALVAGCLSPPLVIKVDQPTAEKLKTEIPVYDRENLKGVSYKVVLPLEATSCKQPLWDLPATEQNAIDQLRFKARTVRANGIMNVSCGAKEGFSLVKNCYETVTCIATAVRVGP